MEKNDLSRRKVLATAGAITAGFGAAGTVVARERDDPSEKFTKQMIQAQQIAKQEGLEERQKYLDRVGINHIEKDHQFAVQKNASEEDRAQPAHEPPICVDPLDCDADINVQFSLTYNPRGEEFHYSYYIRFRYGYADDPSYPPRDIYAGPEDPVDTLGLTWENSSAAKRLEIRDHREVHRSVVTDDYTEFDEGSWTGSGLGILVDGYQASIDSGKTGNDETDWSQMVVAGVFLEKDVDFRPETSVRGIYEYAWKGTEPDVAVSYPASITFKQNEYEESETLQHTPEGKTFHIKAKEVM
ncbi:hypothetical protein [Natrialba chahannaoensis]|uniref:hypothetical protein n=1 Tax=Natrialba chahannaoensis TaxID=68911 RepID=UPI000677F3DA|nr:hypothetical protein [Natrialba chahannaoensis]